MMLRAVFLWLLWAGAGWAAEVIPPVPVSYVVDQAQVLKEATRRQLVQELDAFEGATSNQIIVAIYPKMLSASSVEDYTVRVAQAWGAGQKKKDNGVVLFLFQQDRQLYIQVGYGLEGALPDLLCKRIIDREIVPHLREGDFDAGITSGVKAIMQATRGEYQGGGTGKLAQQNWPKLIFLGLLLYVLLFRGRSHSRVYSGISSSHSGGWGGGGGFSSGGGGFGGGGAGGRW